MPIAALIKSAFRLLAVPFTVAGCSGPALLSATVPTDAMTTHRDLAYGEDARQKLDLYVPARREGTARVVVFFYGGGWDSGSKDGYLFAARPFVEAGYIVAIPDYRIYPEARFPAFVEDGAAALKWLADNAGRFGGRADGMVLAGHSAGAHIAAMLALDTRHTLKAGLDESHIAGFVGLAGPYDFLPFSSNRIRNVFAFGGDERQTQPITFARAGAPPMLLATGDADTTVLPRNSVNLAARLRDLGSPVEVKIYPGLGHVGIATALAPLFDGRAPVVEDALDFLRRYRLTPD